MIMPLRLTPFWGMSVALAGRGLDLLSTWWVTPDLKLEGNPLVRRYGWSFALAISLAIAWVGYSAPDVGIMLGAMSAVMAFSNMQMAFMTRHANDGANALRRLNAQAMHACGLPAFVVESTMLVLPAMVLGLMIVLGTRFDAGNPVSDIGYGMWLWCAAVLCMRALNRFRFQRALKRIQSPA